MASSPVAGAVVLESRSSSTVPARRRIVRSRASFGPCPHCGRGQVHKNGTFPLKDGTRQQRFICDVCSRSVSPTTGTPMAYVKKRSEREQFQQTMGGGSSLRKQAAELGVHPSTTFRWRHKVLSPVSKQPAPQLSGQAAIGETYVAFSRKGQRSKPQGFRRFVDGKPSCVLFLVTESGHRSMIAGAGKLGAEALKPCLAQALAPEAQVSPVGARISAVCQEMGLLHGNGACDAKSHRPLMRGVSRIAAGLHGWLSQFRGVATRYLHHYLAWYDSLVRAYDQVAECPPAKGFEEADRGDAPWPIPLDDDGLSTYFTC